MLLLPYLEQDDVYRAFRRDEPWDSEHNLKLLPRMPATYAAPWTKYVDVPPGHTVIKVFVGPGAAFEPGKKLNLRSDFPDGTPNTLLVAEAGDPVPWSKPDDIPFAPDRPIKLRGLFKNGFRAVTADGSGPHMIPHDCDEAALRAAITRNGGEKVLLPS